VAGNPHVVPLDVALVLGAPVVAPVVAKGGASVATPVEVDVPLFLLVPRVVPSKSVHDGTRIQLMISTNLVVRATEVCSRERSEECGWVVALPSHLRPWRGSTLLGEIVRDLGFER
jgi:hypothetical protein